MIFGLPILTTNVGSIGALLSNGENALFFKPKNPGDLARKVKVLAENVNIRKRLAVNAQKNVKDYLNQFDKVHAEQVFDSIKEVYNEKNLE
jgi:glycosyltransferase involved in cell wall biosynthesis